MANRAELCVIRGARAGDPASQLALGKLYLFGGTGLPRNMPTALHWLDRAARQQQAEAWMLIGSHVPLEHARHCLNEVLPWYQRAYAAGVEQAGLVLAQLAPADPATPVNPQPRLQQPLPQQERLAADAGCRAVAAAAPSVLHAALSGVEAARAGRTPAAGSREQLAGAPALAAHGVEQVIAGPAAARHAARSGPALPAASGGQSTERLEQAAMAGDRAAQLALGLWCARLQRDGQRQADGIATVNFKRAIRWLTMAGGQGDAEAWFALSRIYLKPEFSQRSVAEAQVYLERAAELGHRAAQVACGLQAWRHRRHVAGGDVRAVYWLQKAAAQGSAQAQQQLDRIAQAPRGAAWVQALAPDAIAVLALRQPLLAARLMLAHAFNLTRAETLLLDVKEADHGHCLVVDIRASYGRSKRRLVALRTAQQRQLLDQVVAQFDRAGAAPEGNYRQRLYRLKHCLPALAGAGCSAPG
ncbi:hypothetical protein ASF61_13805 [Duganella sp. Leaf126]|uniref:SEL1-like repeat protein n=1 Tax=Duganella sp. Leaf126 TaxID=1736266 RepID=UPI0006F9197F|nr:SEL1-like repeat protein [Duganella sp. Leaf126]KQQ32619.1 hypothetical protein ASF61_13805 [Duganella sp. Leaf126]